ncbi:MAG: gluconokinase [Flavobacteriaceae bacterium]|nr:gluconokinase [Flavobacteriaceae bacterium]
MAATDPFVIVIMGVSGSGKTTIGELLSQKLSLPFYDADDFHTEENVIKMSGGIPLTDDDRLPWLLKLAKQIKKWKKGSGAILACSALKESYRKILNEADQNIFWVYLYGKSEKIVERLENREGHFFGPEMIKSQFETLEVPDYGIHINCHQNPETIAKLIIDKLEKFYDI